jgi:hypothetical protein
MTERIEIRVDLEETTLCRWGSKTDHPCWRPAVERVFSDDPEPNLCVEHAELFNLAEYESGWACALDAIEEFISGPVSADLYGCLEPLALKMRDEIKQEYARAVAEADAAQLIAEEGPQEG